MLWCRRMRSSPRRHVPCDKKELRMHMEILVNSGPIVSLPQSRHSALRISLSSGTMVIIPRCRPLHQGWPALCATIGHSISCTESSH